MRKLLVLILFIISTSVFSQSSDIKTKTFAKGTSEIANLDLFSLNHVMYLKAFLALDIYPEISTNEMAFIDSTLQVSLSKGKKVQFKLNTKEREPYIMSVIVVRNKKQLQLLITTNYNTKKEKFEKEIKDYTYASMAKIKNGFVIGSVFDLPFRNKKQYKKDKDYISLLNISIFNGEIDSLKLLEWFKLAEETQENKTNNINWLKTYFYLSQKDFLKAETHLNLFNKKSEWEMFSNILTAELDILKKANTMCFRYICYNQKQ